MCLCCEIDYSTDIVLNKKLQYEVFVAYIAFNERVPFFSRQVLQIVDRTGIRQQVKVCKPNIYKDPAKALSYAGPLACPREGTIGPTFRLSRFAMGTLALPLPLTLSIMPPDAQKAPGFHQGLFFFTLKPLPIR